MKVQWRIECGGELIGVILNMDYLPPIGMQIHIDHVYYVVGLRVATEGTRGKYGDASVLFEPTHITILVATEPL